MNGRLRLRALLTGLFLGLGLCIFTPLNNTVLHNTPMGGGHFPLAPFFIIAWMFVIDAFSSRLLSKRPFFSGVELLVIWLMMVLFSAIGFAGLTETFFINITGPGTVRQGRVSLDRSPDTVAAAILVPTIRGRRQPVLRRPGRRQKYGRARRAVLHPVVCLATAAPGLVPVHSRRVLRHDVPHDPVRKTMGGQRAGQLSTDARSPADGRGTGPEAIHIMVVQQLSTYRSDHGRNAPPAQRFAFLLSVRAGNAYAHPCRTILPEIRFVLRVLQTQTLHYSGFHRVRVPDHPADFIFHVDVPPRGWPASSAYSTY